MMKKILLALDYNPSAEKVAKIGYEFCRSMNAEMILLHVLADYTYYTSLDYSPILGFESFQNYQFPNMVEQQALTETADTFLKSIRSFFPDMPVRTMLMEGDTSDRIIEAARQEKVDLIILGSHSRSGFEEIFMGSTAKSIMGKSEIPILVIPIKEEEK